jgi:hypothetical protein
MDFTLSGDGIADTNRLRRQREQRAAKRAAQERNDALARAAVFVQARLRRQLAVLGLHRELRAQVDAFVLSCSSSSSGAERSYGDAVVHLAELPEERSLDGYKPCTDGPDPEELYDATSRPLAFFKVKNRSDCSRLGCLCRCILGSICNYTNLATSTSRSVAWEKQLGSLLLQVCHRLSESSKLTGLRRPLAHIFAPSLL